MVVLKKCGSSLADLHSASGFESKIHYTFNFGMANSPLVTCLPVLFEVKTTYFYFIVIFILFVYYFYLIFFIILVLSPRFRGVPGRSRRVPGGSG